MTHAPGFEIPHKIINTKMVDSVFNRTEEGSRFDTVLLA
jgi:hypothetical protein